MNGITYRNYNSTAASEGPAGRVSIRWRRFVWVSSLVVTLSGVVQDDHEVIAALQSIAALTLGEAVGKRIPIVVEADAQDSRHWHDWIAKLPGVVQVEVAFVSFEEVHSPQERQLEDQHV